MNSSTTTTQNQTSSSSSSEVDKALGQTDFGAWIAENKTPVLSAVALIIVGIFGYGIYNNMKTEKENKYASALHALVSENIKPFNEGKLSADKFTEDFKTTWQPMGSFEGAAPYLLEVTNALSAKGNNQKAYELITMALERTSNPQLNYFYGIRAATMAEDLNKPGEAIDHLTKVLGGGAKYMEGKIYLDLGRLYRATGDSEKAKSSFEYVIEKGKEAEFKKMARLYLEEL